MSRKKKIKTYIIEHFTMTEIQSTVQSHLSGIPEIPDTGDSVVFLFLQI